MKYIDDMSLIREIERDYGLPDLIGSPKQVKWAEKIRANILFHIRYIAEELHSAEIMQTYDMMRIDPDARFWIDSRDMQRVYIDEANKAFFGKGFPEMYVYRPKHPTKDGMVNIIHMDGLVYYHYPKDADFYSIVSGAGMRFAGAAWHSYPCNLESQARILLQSGFTINCDTELQIDTAIDIPEDLLDED